MVRDTFRIRSCARADIQLQRGYELKMPVKRGARLVMASEGWKHGSPAPTRRAVARSRLLIPSNAPPLPDTRIGRFSPATRRVAQQNIDKLHLARSPSCRKGPGRSPRVLACDFQLPAKVHSSDILKLLPLAHSQTLQGRRPNRSGVVEHRLAVFKEGVASCIFDDDPVDPVRFGFPDVW